MRKISLALLCMIIGLINNNCDPHWQLGPARWAGAKSINEAKERCVFAGSYYSEPFEYEDSIFHLKLVFSDIYAEYYHWFDEKDSTWKHIDHTYLCAEIDSIKSFGIDKLNPTSNNHWSTVLGYFGVHVSCISFGTNIIVFSPNEHFSDSLVVPVHATITYKKTINVPEQNEISFGKMIFKRIED